MRTICVGCTLLEAHIFGASGGTSRAETERCFNAGVACGTLALASGFGAREALATSRAGEASVEACVALRTALAVRVFNALDAAVKFDVADQPRSAGG